MLNNKGFFLIESILLFMIACMLTLVLSLCVKSYYAIRGRETPMEKQEERIKQVYE